MGQKFTKKKKGKRKKEKEKRVGSQQLVMQTTDFNILG
jgi:hypothetical protein